MVTDAEIDAINVRLRAIEDQINKLIVALNNTASYNTVNSLIVESTQSVEDLNTRVAALETQMQLIRSELTG